MAYPAAVERWRPLVSKYFRPEDVDKALYVIQHESGGDPSIKASVPSEQSWGLFQANIGGGLGTGYTVQQLQDPETNIRIASQAVYGGSGWRPWGEGALYQGQPFGALGRNPYPGGSSGRGFTAPPPPAGGSTMTPEDQIVLDSIAKRVSKRPDATWATLTGDELFKARIVAKEAGIDTSPSTSTAGQVTATNAPERQVVNGRVMMWDGTGFNIDLGPSSAPNDAVTRPQGAITQNDLVGAGADFSTPGVALVKTAQGTQRYVRQPDGTWAASGTPETAKTETAKKSPSVQAAEQLVATQRVLGGGQATAPGAQQAQTQQPTAPQSPMQSTGQAPEDIMGGGSPYYGQPQEIRGPADIFGQPGQLAGVSIPYAGGSYQYNNGQAAQTIAAGGMIPTGDPQKDMQTALALNAKRANLLAEYGDPLKVQSMFDSMNLGNDVYSRAKAVSAAEQAADRAISGDRPPPYGTDNLTASMLSQYITPRPEEPGVEYPPAPAAFADGTEPDQPILAGARTASRGTAAMDTGPRMLSSGNIMRVRDGESMFRPATGGSWQNAAQNSMPSWQDYINQFWDGWEVGPGHILRPQQQHLFQQMVSGWQQKNGVGGGGVNFGSDGPLPWEGIYNGRPQTFSFGGSRGPRSIGIGAYATGTETPIMAGSPMSYTPPDTSAPGKPGFMTPEPLAFVGMNTGQTHGIAGERGPEAISVTPQPQMQAPYKSQRPVMLVDPLRVLMDMAA